MISTLRWSGTPTGSAIYFILRDAQNCAKWFNFSTGVFEDVSSGANYLNYVRVATQEQFNGTNTGVYCASVPIEITQQNLSAEVYVKDRQGSTPALSDPTRVSFSYSPRHNVVELSSDAVECLAAKVLSMSACSASQKSLSQWSVDVAADSLAALISLNMNFQPVVTSAGSYVNVKHPCNNTILATLVWNTPAAAAGTTSVCATVGSGSSGCC